MHWFTDEYYTEKNSDQTTDYHLHDKLWTYWSILVHTSLSVW